MVRELKVITDQDGGGYGGIGIAFLVFWTALFTLSLISAIIFSCADGVSEDKLLQVIQIFMVEDVLLVVAVLDVVQLVVDKSLLPHYFYEPEILDKFHLA
ncbi:hypothetical protein CRYUN_Cryun13aG0061000 [Craigia yunnanensis]